MLIPPNLIANADDFGSKSSVNQAVLLCYQLGYINSASLIVNHPGFFEAVDMIHTHDVITNIGLHVNFADGKPVTNFDNNDYLTADGHWDLKKTNRKINFLDRATTKLFFAEIEAQVNKVIDAKVKLLHIDSHYHLHTLPCFYRLFLQVAHKYSLKIRLAQTYNNGNYEKYMFRNYVNKQVKKSKTNYTDLFETIDHFLDIPPVNQNHLLTEVMLHPDLADNGILTDHFSASDMTKWVDFLNNNI